jgi:hypothetical protein
MTASLAVTLVLCAHGLGTFLRQQNPTMAEPAVDLRADRAAGADDRRDRGDPGSLPVGLAELTGLDTLGPVVGSAAFLIINLLVYTGATMLSYLAHAPSDKAGTELTDAQRDLKVATRRVRNHERQLSRAGAASEEAFEAMRAAAEQTIAYYRGLMAAYCTANLRARGNPETPESLRVLPTIEIPELFAVRR